MIRLHALQAVTPAAAAAVVVAETCLTAARAVGVASFLTGTVAVRAVVAVDVTGLMLAAGLGGVQRVPLCCSVLEMSRLVGIGQLLMMWG